MSSTITDVARKAKVSANTVSKIVNLGKDEEFSPETIRRVKRAARALNYRRHQFARSLRTGRTGLVGITTIGGDPGYFEQPYSARVYRGVADVLKERNMRMVFHNYDVKGHPEQYLDMIENRSVDGVIFLLLSGQVNHFKTVIIKKLRKLGIPFMAVHSLPDQLGCHSVGLDSELGGRLGAEHLAGHGYTSVGSVIRKPGEPHGKNLYRGFCRVLEKHGLAPGNGHVATVSTFNFNAGYEAAGRLLKKNKKLPRALFVLDEQVAYGVMRKFAETAIRVPEDVALCSFSGVHSNALLLSGLTTIRQPARQKGEQAARFMLDMLDKPERMKKPKTYIFKPELFVQTTCGCNSELNK